MQGIHSAAGECFLTGRRIHCWIEPFLIVVGQVTSLLDEINIILRKIGSDYWNESGLMVECSFQTAREALPSWLREPIKPGLDSMGSWLLPKENRFMLKGIS